MKILRIIKEEILPLDGRKNLILLIIIACVFQLVLFYAPALADEAAGAAMSSNQGRETLIQDPETLILNDDPVSTTSAAISVIPGASPASSTPAISASTPAAASSTPLLATSTPATATSTPATATSTPAVKVINTSVHVITAYNSEVGQTDSDPCTTADGFNVCQHRTEDTIAANFLNFGAKVQIPELFGNRVFIVRDRMNRKHPDRVDVWMNGHQAAMDFGVKVAQIRVIE